MSRWAGSVCVAAITILLAAGCGEEKLPSRDEIPLLRENLFALQKAILARNPSAIDSLLSVEILDAGQDSDSLLRFVYGPADNFPFYRLGDYEIFFGNDVAVIDCYIMDSTQKDDRPLRLLYTHDSTLWLLKEFRVGDSAANIDSQS